MEPLNLPTPIAVIGPTGTGKSDLAVALACRLGGEVVNIDAMAQYRGMDIGTAKMPEAARRGVPHHQLDVLDVTETATVARYQQAARGDVETIMGSGSRPIIVGGSMMYIQALLDDWSFPATDPDVRARWETELAAVGVGEMHRRLAEVDPAAAAVILDTDARRIVRALEVVELTGRPFAASAPHRGTPRWSTSIVALDCATDTLDARLRARTEAMFEAGLVDEVSALSTRGLREGLTASRAIGYAQVLEVLDATMDLGAAREQTFTGTRRYVRRQRSWFRRDTRIRWFDACSDRLLDHVTRHLDAIDIR